LSLLLLLEGLDRSRWCPHVVVPDEGEVARRVRLLDIPVHVIPLPTLRRPGPAILHSLHSLRRLADMTQARLLHANGSRAMFYAGLASLLSRRPVIWHVRIAEPDVIQDRLLFRLAQAVIVNSGAVAKRFAWDTSAKLHRIYNGVDLSRFHPRQSPPGLRSALGFPDTCRIVGSIGRFVQFKGYTHLIDAARLVHDAQPDVHWLLVGDGELREQLEQQSHRLGLQRHIHFTGWREDTPDLLALLDVFVLPSLAEHFGRVLIEAMAMAKPVVATGAGGVPEIVVHDETGWLVPPGEAEPLAAAVLALLQDPKKAARYASAGLRRASEMFSAQSHVSAVESLYGSLL